MFIILKTFLFPLCILFIDNKMRYCKTRPWRFTSDHNIFYYESDTTFVESYMGPLAPRKTPHWQPAADAAWYKYDSAWDIQRSNPGISMDHDWLDKAKRPFFYQHEPPFDIPHGYPENHQPNFWVYHDTLGNLCPTSVPRVRPPLNTDKFICEFNNIHEPAPTSGRFEFWGSPPLRDDTFF